MHYGTVETSKGKYKVSEVIESHYQYHVVDIETQKTHLMLLIKSQQSYELILK